MGRADTALLAFNRGLISRLGLARIDLKRMSLSAETMTNWMPRVLGSMSIRPGLSYLGATYLNKAARFLKFIFSTTDTALIELTAYDMRIWVNDSLFTVGTVSTTILNELFAVSLVNWTDNDEAGAASTWTADGMQLVGTGTAAAIRDQQITVAAADQNARHTIYVIVANGPVTFSIGSTLGGDEYISRTSLDTGNHYLSFTPTGDFYIRFLSRVQRSVVVRTCYMADPGAAILDTPWAESDLDNITFDQSGDIIYVACDGVKQKKIERRGTYSWSIADYVAEDGPFLVENTSTTTITPSALTGDITLAASVPLFKSTHVGALFSLTSEGQSVTKTITAQNTFTNSIRITGVTTGRAFSIIITGLSATGSTVSLQRSFDGSTWADVSGKTWTADTTESYTDGLDNQIVYYRIGVKTGDYVAGTIITQLQVGSGSIRGIVRVTGYTNSTTVNAQVLTDLGGTAATAIWQEGAWSPYRGYPSAVSLHDGRLWWAGRNGVWGSISDAFNSFDETFEGDAGPISRTIGSGPVDKINFLLSLQRMIIGAQGSELSVRASSLDDPLTPTAFTMKECSTQGSSSVQAIKLDKRGVYVNRSGMKLFELAFDPQTYDYTSADMTAFNPELLYPGAVRMDVQRQPDTRIHVVKSDGTVAICVHDPVENVLCWVTFETDGIVEDVVTMPASDGNIDDQVYYVVKRTINGSTVRYLEKWAQERDCRGDQQLCKLADSFLTYSGVSTTAITGLSHLEGESVVVWADGADVGTDDSSSPWVQRYTVSGGQITLSTAASNVVVGLPYTAKFKSTKLASASSSRQPINAQKQLNHVGFILADTHTKGIKYGFDFDNLDDMPGIEDGIAVGSAVNVAYDQQTIEFPGIWTTDMRICLQAQAPRPCTVLAVSIDSDLNR